MAKKILRIFCIIIITAIIFLILPFIIAPIADNIALNAFKHEVISVFQLPPSTEMVEVVSGCGNTSGTGNHTELYVAILVKTKLTNEQWREYYPCSQNAGDGIKTLPMEIIGLSFQHLNDDYHFADGFYIIEDAKSAPLSWLDLRGN